MIKLEDLQRVADALEPALVLLQQIAHVPQGNAYRLTLDFTVVDDRHFIIPPGNPVLQPSAGPDGATNPQLRALNRGAHQVRVVDERNLLDDSNKDGEQKK